MGQVRAKFQVTGKTESEVTLIPVYTGSEENKRFWKYTPSGTIQMHIDNPEALEQFEMGKEYYVDFTEATE